MSKLNEATVQYGLAKHLEKFGWVYADDETLGRPVDGVFLANDLEASLIRLNPEIAENPARTGEVLQGSAGRFFFHHEDKKQKGASHQIWVNSALS